MLLASGSLLVMSVVKALFYAIPFRYWCWPSLLLLVLMLLPVITWQLDQTSQQLQIMHRNVQMENTQWQRYLRLLSAAPLAQLFEANNRTSLEVALRESAQSLQVIQEVQIDSFQVVSAESFSVDDELGELIKPIQITIEATLHHAPALLTILSRISQVAGWRVTEVRGCAMQRLESEIVVACSIDIHHWSWVTHSKKDVR